MFFPVRRLGPIVITSVFTALAGCTIPDRPPTLVDGGSAVEDGAPSLGDAARDLSLGDAPRDASDVSASDRIDGSASDGVVRDGPNAPTDALPDAPTVCIAGGSCLPANPCHQGAWECREGGAPTCRDTSQSQTNGTACDKGVCLDGMCQACAAGTMCDVANKPCRVGTIACSTGAPVCTETDNKPNGASCGAGQVCQAGVCKPCATGEACTPTNACHEGKLDCSGPNPTCSDTGMNIPAGGPCGQDKVCDSAGACVACVAGSTCAVASNPCREGTTACNTGAPVCIESGNTPNGVGCGTNKVCSGGTCITCSAGLSCVPSNSCHQGTQACSPAVECIDTGSAVMDGMSCGMDKVCSGGKCETCVSGQSCPLSNACRVGTTSCSTGVSKCNETGDQKDGTSCGMNQVCSKGLCGDCAMNAPCTPTAEPCHAGTLNCSSGTPVCTDTGMPLANGSNCGTAEQVCRGGMCVTCKGGGLCSPTDLCKTGTYSCATGSPVCEANGNKAPGEECDVGKVCNNTGSCVICNEGGACTPASNRCHKGALSCATGTGVCNDTGAPADNGLECGTSSYCYNGTCNACRKGQSCAPLNKCKNGAFTCDTGMEVCSETTNKSSGASCGQGATCTNGQMTSAETCNGSGVCSPPTVTGCASNACNAAGTACLVCGAGQAACGTSCCAAGQSCCPGNQCLTLDTTANCGSCGNVCPAGNFCNSSRTCQLQTWCTSQKAPDGIAAADYQCLDFDTGLPSTQFWVPASVTQFGSLGLMTNRVRSAPNALEAFVQNADELDPTAPAPSRILYWTVGGTPRLLTIVTDIYPLQPHGFGNGYVSYICLAFGGSRQACLSYAVPPDLSPNASNFTITTPLSSDQWCGTPTAIPFDQWSRVTFTLATDGRVTLSANGETINCTTGSGATAGGAQVIIGAQGVGNGHYGQVVFDNLVTYLAR
jgi:hypothetical protein